MEHMINGGLLRQRVRVHLVGVGGNGAQMAHALARLDIAIRALGHPEGLHVTAYDSDSVSEANVGRQVYSAADIGLNKAVVTVHRLNQFYGLDWEAVPTQYKPESGYARSPHLLVSCVDSAKSRRDLHHALFRSDAGVSYWLDLGNTNASGQVVLGEPCVGRLPATAEWGRLPCVTELFPQLLDTAVEELNEPSCSVRISLAAQGLFVNDLVVRWASQLLYELFSDGPIRHHGVILNVATKRSAPIDVDPVVWRRFGIKRRKPSAPKGKAATGGEPKVV